MTADAPARGTVAHVILDQAHHPGDHVLESNVLSLRVYLPGDGAKGAEVQVAVVDGCLVVIAAGQVVLADRDVRGFARLRVIPD